MFHLVFLIDFLIHQKDTFHSYFFTWLLKNEKDEERQDQEQEKQEEQDGEEEEKKDQKKKKKKRKSRTRKGIKSRFNMATVATE